MEKLNPMPPPFDMTGFQEAIKIAIAYFEERFNGVIIFWNALNITHGQMPGEIIIRCEVMCLTADGTRAPGYEPARYGLVVKNGQVKNSNSYLLGPWPVPRQP